jgi:hypothetical protein
MLETTRPTAGVDEGGYFLIAEFSNKNSEQVQEMIQLLRHPDGIAEVESRDDDAVVLRIRPDIPGL